MWRLLGDMVRMMVVQVGGAETLLLRCTVLVREEDLELGSKKAIPE